MGATRWALGAMCLLAVAACGRRPLYKPPATSLTAADALAGKSAPPPPGSPAVLSPQEVFSRAEEHLQVKGYRRRGPIQEKDALGPDAAFAFAVQSQGGQCVAILGAAPATSDLNLVLLDAAGKTIGYNVGADPHPWVVACPESEERLVARFQMPRGQSAFQYAVYEGSPDSRPDLASVLGSGKTAEIARVSLDPETKKRLDALDDRLGRAGYERRTDAIGETLRGGQARDFRLNLKENQCYAFATFGGPGVTRTELALLDMEGTTVQRNVTGTQDNVIEHCASGTQTHLLRAWLAEGNGPVFTAAYQKDDGDAGVIGSESEEAPGLEDRFRLTDGDLRARGYLRPKQPVLGSTEKGKRSDLPVRLEGGKCYALSVVGDDNTGDLELRLFSPAGAEVDRHTEGSSRPIVRVCAARTGDYRLRITHSGGNASFYLAEYVWPRGTRGPFGLQGVTYVRFAEMTHLLSLEGYEPDIDLDPGDGVLAARGSKKNHDVELIAGRCYALLTVGGEGVHRLETSLEQGSHRLARDTSQNAAPSLRYCPAESGTFRFQVQAREGQGAYFFQVFRRGSTP
ncbi:MAG: hypothetical protein KC416_00285 [Myxococcales bacterium]|nr:hypothetical protein [Myxococcales bacterium]